MQKNKAMKKRLRLKSKYKKKVTIFLILIFSILFFYSLFHIIIWKFDSNKTNNQINELQTTVKTNEIEDTKTTQIIKQLDEIDKANPYWDYIKMKLIDVNFNELQKVNNETIGWIQVNGTNINYPFVQTKDNKYYLTHSYNKSKNSAGWVFLDYRNNFELDKNNIIYAHGRLDKTMFGSLKNILSSGWLNNKDNYVIKISTEKENSLWQVFSVYQIPTTSDYLKTNFNNDNEFLEFANMLLNRSAHNFTTSIKAYDKILTLSTCLNDNERVVLHAKLIKIAKK